MFHFRLAQKVSELLDSFKPGTISYRPFKKPEREHRIIDNNNNDHSDEALRQRLYVDLQRPRPFYRTTSVNTQIVNEEIIHRNPPSLQVIRFDLARKFKLSSKLNVEWEKCQMRSGRRVNAEWEMSDSEMTESPFCAS